jgi:hypothetical protein
MLEMVVDKNIKELSALTGTQERGKTAELKQAQTLRNILQKNASHP